MATDDPKTDAQGKPRSDAGPAKPIGEAPDADTTPTVATQRQERERNPLASSVAILWGLFIAGAVFYNAFEPIKSFVNGHIPWVVGAAAVIALMPFVPKVGDWFRIAPATKQAAVIIFLLIPIIVGLLASILLLDDPVRVPLIRLVFLFTVTLFPALLYYLFIAARRDSLLNEFIGNLDRLGLLARQAIATRARPEGSEGQKSDNEPDRIIWSTEAGQSRDLRIRTYLERFEAIYGRLPEGLIERIIEITRSERHSTGSEDQKESLFEGRFEWSNIFSTETTLPVIGATALIALGWVVTLPPLLSPSDHQEALAWSLQALINSDSSDLATAASPTPSGADVAEAAKPPKASSSSREFVVISWYSALEPIKPTAVHFAFLGAYFFSLQMLFRRFVRRDLGPNAYLAVALRIVLAVIGVWIAMVALDALGLGESLDNSTKLTLAFAVGAFPVIVWKLVTAVTKKVPGMAMALPSLKSDLPLSKLSGLTIWHETRLEEEDVENVQNMATADIVELMLHTRFPPDRIIAWVDEAVLLVHLGAEEIAAPQGLFTVQLRPRGIRNASTLVAAYERAKARKEVDKFLSMTPGEPNRLRSLIDTIATNPNLALIERWRGIWFPSLSAPNG